MSRTMPAHSGGIVCSQMQHMPEAATSSRALAAHKEVIWVQLCSGSLLCLWSDAVDVGHWVSELLSSGMEGGGLRNPLRSRHLSLAG